jgi:hypothetical protein
MGFLDSFFGKKSLKGAKLDRLFALSTASVTLESEFGLRSSGTAAVVFKPLSASEFVRVENEVQALLEHVAQESQSKVRRREDSYGYTWLVVEDEQFEDLVTTSHLISGELEQHGFGDRLLAAAFGFKGSDRDVMLIYGYKNGAFWPFVPTGEDKGRDNAEELRLKSQLEGELPIEPDISKWFGLFGAPL